MKVIGLKPDNFEPVSIVEKSEPKQAGLGLSPIQSTSNATVESNDRKVANNEPSSLVIDFINRLRAKKKNKDENKTGSPNKSLFAQRQRSYLRVIYFKVLLSQKGAKIDKIL